MPQVTFKIEKQAPAISISGSSENLELFHGIGNTLGFNITGGSDFSMPITIFHVKEGSRAEAAGLKLGDSIVTVNDKDTSGMILQEANNVLEQAAQQDVKLGVIKFDEIDEANPEKKPEVHNVILEGKRKAQRFPFEEELCPPRGAWVEKAERKAWHPIMWPTPEFSQPEVYQKELPHKRMIRNLRKLLTEVADKPAEREKHLELILMGSTNVELTIKSMQRQLLQISEKIPDDIMLTLLKSFAQILTREPEPVQKTPFIRAFAKIRDDNIETQFSAIVEEDEEQLKDYESGNSEGENDCTFNYKVTTNTEEIVYSVVGNDQDETAKNETTDDVNEPNSSSDEPSLLSPVGISENIDEGIEVEMPKLLPADETMTEFEKIVDQEETTMSQQNSNEDDVVESNSFENSDINSYENGDERIMDSILVEELIHYEEPIPVEAPKVSLDDIQREIQEMQQFLHRKGVDQTKENNSDNQKSNGNVNNQEAVDLRSIEDAYKVDVYLMLKNHNSQKQNSHKKHHHSKYNRSESYIDEIIEAGPIIDPSIPNTKEDFMKVKSVAERINRKQQKVQALDVSWQNLCENQKKLYKHSQFEKSKKNVEEQQKNIKFN